MRDPQAADRGRRDAPCHTRPANGATSTASKLTLKRKYTYRGRHLSYFNAGCPAEPGVRRISYHLADATFSFAGHESIELQQSKTCGVKE